MTNIRQVTAYEPAIKEFLERHVDRLNEEIPRGLWVYERNGKPDVMLLAYTEPYLRLSFITEEGYRPASLLRLGSAFDSWAEKNGITRYTMTVSEEDNPYRLMVERLGAVELRRAGGWIEYVFEPKKEYNLEDGIRLWAPQDWVPLRRLMREFLKEDVASGGELPPTRANVEEHIRQGIQGAQSGDPCFVAQADDGLLGFVLVRGSRPGLYEPTPKTCWALGLYVPPHLRRQGWGRRLYQAALDRARLAGYTRIAAVARTKTALTLHKSLGFQPGGVVVEQTLGEK